MTTKGAEAGLHTLWGVAHSYYTGKIRSYLIKKGIAFREVYPSHPEFSARVMPAVGHLVVPILETPDGAIIQDTTDMIEHLEARFPAPPMVPDTPVQRAVAWLLGAFGSEALLPVGMSYRWWYRAEQESFLRAEFGRISYAGPDREARDAAGRDLMDYFNDFLPRLGVTSETVATFEAAYLELLDVLDIHFQRAPYLLGGRPSIADFGFMAPLYAHLGRDPVPAKLMKDRAPNVYRWTERMNLAAIADGEFSDCPETYLADDTIATTLEPLLELVFQDWGVELRTDAALFNAWVASDPPPAAGCPVSDDGARRVHPTLGYVDYTWRGCTVHRTSQPHGLWHFAKAAAYARELTGEPRQRFDALINRTGGAETMAIELARPMKRENYVLVLG